MDRDKMVGQDEAEKGERMRLGAYSWFARSVERGDNEGLRALVADGFDPNFATYGKFTPLALAVSLRREKTMARLVEMGAAQDAKGSMAIDAAVHGDLDKELLFLLSKGARPRTEPIGGYSSLGVAAANGSFKCMAILLSSGVFDSDLDAENAGEGRPPLVAAASGGFLDCVVLLSDAGADVNRRSLSGRGESSLDSAICAKESGVDVVRELLRRGARFDEAGQLGKTPLALASWLGNWRGAQALLERGADVCKADDFGASPLMLASRSGSARCVEQLLAAGADAEQAAGKGMTALMEAARGLDAQGKRDCDSAKCVELLLEAGADPMAQSASGGETKEMRRAIDYARLAGKTECALVLEAWEERLALGESVSSTEKRTRTGMRI